MFAQIGVDLSIADNKEGLEKLQKIITLIQKCVYSLEGSLNKLVMDDKGCTLICIWGLSPFSHDDDACRAVLCAIKLQKELMQDLNCFCNIGITTGIVFAGVVGTSGSRKEYSVIGDTVNLAARLMAYPKYTDGSIRNIYTDRQTKIDASDKIKFIYKTHATLKGKSDKIPIFSPIDPDSELLCEKQDRSRLLLTHPNPLLLDNFSKYQYSDSIMIGRHRIREAAYSDLKKFLSEYARPAIGVISGPPGIGKTLFSRVLCDDIEKSLSDKVRIFATQINPLSEKKFLNNWRPILMGILNLLYPVNKAEFIENLCKSKEFADVIKDKLFLIEDLFSIKLPSGYNKEEQYKQEENFTKKEEFPKEFIDSIFPFIISIFEKISQNYIPILFFDDSSHMDIVFL